MRNYDKKRKRQGIPLRYLLPGFGVVLLGTATMADVMPQSTLPAFVPPPELRSNGKWDAFKALWHEVNAIEPARPEIVPPEGRRFADLNTKPSAETTRLQWRESDLLGYGNRAYYLALDEERAARLQASLFRLFDVPENAMWNEVGFWRHGVSVTEALIEKNASIEAQMLARLLQLRIQQMSMVKYSFSGYELIGNTCKFSRASPPVCSYGHLSDVPPSYYMIGAIDRIEARVDALMGLRAKNVISESVFMAALADIWNDTKLVLFLDALNGAWEYDWHDPAPRIEKHDFSKSLGKDADLRHVQFWERAVEASMSRLPESNAEVDKQAKQLKARLAELRAAYPRLKGLLAELER